MNIHRSIQPSTLLKNSFISIDALANALVYGNMNNNAIDDLEDLDDLEDDFKRWLINEAKVDSFKILKPDNRISELVIDKFGSKAKVCKESLVHFLSSNDHGLSTNRFVIECKLYFIKNNQTSGLWIQYQNERNEISVKQLETGRFKLYQSSAGDWLLDAEVLHDYGIENNIENKDKVSSKTFRVDRCLKIDISDELRGCPF